MMAPPDRRARLPVAGQIGLVVVEAPSGYGKTWQLRLRAGPDAVRARPGAVVAALERITVTLAACESAEPIELVVDDAHGLDDVEVDALARLAVSLADRLSMTIAGRWIADDLRAVAATLDATFVRPGDLAISITDLAVLAPEIDPMVAAAIVDAADGCTRAAVEAIGAAGRPDRDPVRIAAAHVRDAARLAMARLCDDDCEVVRVVARVGGLPVELVADLGGPGFASRVVGTGVPLVRSADGAVDVAVASEFRVGALRPATVAATTELLVRWGRHLDAIELSIAAGDPEAACRIAAGLPESITETSDPLALLDRLAQLGPRALRDPAIAVVQAATLRALGRHELELEAIDRAAALLDAAAAPELHRRVCAEGGRALLLRGDRDGARNLLTALVGELGDGEHATYARIHECLAECGASSDARLDLVRAEAHYRTAIAAWEACGEGGRARACRRNLALAVLVPLERTDEARVVLSMVAASPDLSPVERCRTRLAEGFALLNAGQLGEADDVLGEASVLAGRHETPRMLASAAWGRAIVASRRRDLAATLQWVAAAENTALTDDDDVLGVPFLCDMATAFGALGRLDLAATYAARASRRSTLFADLVRFTEFVVAARRGEITSAADVAAQIDRTAPTERWRVELVGAHSLARHGELDDARRLLDTAIDGARALGQDLVHLGEGRELAALESLLDGRAASGSVATPTAGLRLVVDRAPVRQLHVTTSPMVVVDNDGSRDVPPGNPEKLIAVVVAAGGSATLDQIGDAFWPDVPRSTSRNRLRNVLLRVRAAVGDLVVRTVNGVRLADDVRSDLLEFERLAADATTAMRVDPDVAGRLARAALDVLHGPVFVSFEYEEWAAAARRATSARCIALLDFLSVESEDAGDLAGAQHYAERALAHDRLADSRYVRLAELLARQDRVAAAITVLDEALDVARSLGVTADGDVRSRRDAFVRRTATAR